MSKKSVKTKSSVKQTDTTHAAPNYHDIAEKQYQEFARKYNTRDGHSLTLAEVRQIRRMCRNYLTHIITTHYASTDIKMLQRKNSVLHMINPLGVAKFIQDEIGILLPSGCTCALSVLSGLCIAADEDPKKYTKISGKEAEYCITALNTCRAASY